MTAEQKTLMRVETATDAPFAIRVNVRALSDEDLAQELAERKAEFDLLVRDLDERKIEGLGLGRLRPTTPSWYAKPTRSSPPCRPTRPRVNSPAPKVRRR
ncbi:hypothetical protein [Nocardia fluminea]|uniref:Uncharacterized protein n=1 Tax=Nocardia fluminea TaxID=134984 RepID=A0A2N3V5B4_9NOCA|nr:hypothetical protein [Nocardia fluminea]PKV76819.1 hypothetical protein ATK86_7226 [Nocardia fluminea]